METGGGLYSASIPKGNTIEFKMGQEILIYHNGWFLETYPEYIVAVGKIKILKQNSDIDIPENILRYCYSNTDNVKVNIFELTTKNMEVEIRDSNELPYNYLEEYSIYHKVRNENYTGITYKQGENTGNSIAPSMGTGPEFLWEEVNKNNEILMQDTVNMSKQKIKEDTIVNIKADWSNLYGELDSRRI